MRSHRYGNGAMPTCHGFSPDRLRALRAEAGMTVRGLAGRMGYAKCGPITEWECGIHVPSEQNVNELARVLDVPRSMLMEDE